MIKLSKLNVAIGEDTKVENLDKVKKGMLYSQAFLKKFFTALDTYNGPSFSNYKRMKSDSEITEDILSEGYDESFAKKWVKHVKDERKFKDNAERVKALKEKMTTFLVKDLRIPIGRREDVFKVVDGLDVERFDSMSDNIRNTNGKFTFQKRSSKASSMTAGNDEHNYMMLGRLKSDCEYFLGNGNGYEKHLWAGNVEEQIEEMKKLWNQVSTKPEWLTMKEIESYEKEMLKKVKK